MVDGMSATRTTEIQHYFQESSPVILKNLDRAQSLLQKL